MVYCLIIFQRFLNHFFILIPSENSDFCALLNWIDVYLSNEDNRAFKFQIESVNHIDKPEGLK